MTLLGNILVLQLQLAMIGGPNSQTSPVACYRTLDSAGLDIAGADVPHQLDQALATGIYSTMASLQTIDTVFYEAQRQVAYQSMPFLAHAWLTPCSESVNAARQ